MRRDGFIIGFSAAFGASVLLCLLFLAWRFAAASLSVAPPFVAAFAVALLAEPLVDRLTRESKWIHGRRLRAVLVVYAFFIVILGVLLTFLVPTLINQASDLAQNLPGYVQGLRDQINSYLHTHHALGPFRLPPNVETLTAQYSDQIGNALKVSASRIVEVLLGSVSGLLNVVLVPIVAFYLMVDLPRLRGRFLFHLPERIRRQFQKTATDVGGVFGNYVRGMTLVSLAYGVVATIVFLLFGLKAYALLLGFVAGVLYAVPYVGPFTTALLSCIVYLATGHSPGATAGLLAGVLAQNQIFDNLIVPRIVGDSVGLHPLLTIFALFLGGELFGIWGMLLSVPVAASLQVVLFRLFPRLKAPTPLSLLMPTAADKDDATVVRDAGAAEQVREG